MATTNMQDIHAETLDDVKKVIKANAKNGKWYVLRFNGYTFKIYQLWAQIMQTPEGLRGSGAMGQTTQRAFFNEICQFMGVDNGQ